MNNKLKLIFQRFQFSVLTYFVNVCLFKLDINKKENTKKEKSDNVWRDVFNPGANPTKMLGKKDIMDIVNDPKQDSSIWDYLINSEESKQKVEDFKKSTKEGPY